MTRSILLILLFAGLWNESIAQKIDHLQSYSAIERTEYFRFNYDNDLFAGTDKNYTQGFNFELVAPFLDANPVNYLFYRPESFDIQFGIAIEHIVYTPENFVAPEIQVGDRPFAAAIYLKSFMVATNQAKAIRFTSSLSTGIIGPAAFGEAMQTGIHKVTESQIPEGWPNQIQNDLVISYAMGLEKQMLRINDLFSIQAQANVALGTLFTGAATGVNFTFGMLNAPFKSGSEKEIKLFAYAAPTVHIIGYDATLQGGLFNDNSRYTIAAKDIERVTGQLNYGVVLQIKAMYLEYSRAVITREFTTGNSAKWGGIKVGFGF